MRQFQTLVGAAIAALAISAAHGEDVVPAGPIDATEAAAAPQPLPTPVVMHAKLNSTQAVLSGLLQEDYARIREAARDLRSLARDVPTQTVPRADERDEATSAEADAVYAHFRYELIRQAAELERMAADRNLAGAVYVHQQLTSACIGCHQHLRRTEAPGALLLFTAEPRTAIRAANDADR